MDPTLPADPPYTRVPAPAPQPLSLPATEVLLNRLVQSGVMITGENAGPPQPPPRQSVNVPPLALGGSQFLGRESGSQEPRDGRLSSSSSNVSQTPVVLAMKNPVAI